MSDNTDLLKKKDYREAESLLKNNFFQVNIRAAMRQILDNRMIECDTSLSPEIAVDIIRYRQLLNEMETIIDKVIKDGRAIEARDMKAIQAKVEKDKKNEREPQIMR